MQQKHIMVVEDDEIILSLFSHLMMREGYKVTTAVDGLEGEKLIETLSPPPDLVLLDVMLPYLNGLLLVKKIRTTPGWEHLPILVLTGRSYEQDIIRAFSMGVNDYMTKPFNMNELLARIKRYLLVNEGQKLRVG